MKRAPLIVAGVIFLAVGFMHLLRVILKARVTVGNYNVPLQLSVCAFVVAFLMAFWMFKTPGCK